MKNMTSGEYATVNAIDLTQFSISELQNAIYDKLKIPRLEECVDADLGNGLTNPTQG